MRNHVQLGRFTVGPLDENEISDFLEAHGGRLVEAPAKPADRTAWLVESDGLRYLASRRDEDDGNDFYWTGEIDHALKFDCEVAASGVISIMRTMDPEPLRMIDRRRAEVLDGFVHAKPTEHMWTS